MARNKGTQIGDGWSQAKLRQDRWFFDQHGRRFYGNVEKSTQRPVGGGLSPDFSAPWFAPEKYIVFYAETQALADRKYRQGDFYWDYEQMFQDDVYANRAYYMKAAQEAAARNWPLPKVGQPVYQQLRAIIGETPRSPVIARAAQRGDAWLLGVPGAAVNTALRDLLYPENEWDRWYRDGFERADDPTGGQPLSPADQATLQDEVDAGKATWGDQAPALMPNAEQTSEIESLRRQVAALQMAQAAGDRNAAWEPVERPVVETPVAPAKTLSNEYRKFVTKMRQIENPTTGAVYTMQEIGRMWADEKGTRATAGAGT